ncbi:hypothetical protein HY839_03405 [Candidatus Azambacteria bacterium]|nr:hypothetical protein [Candidatus Azambacteria bacterium]
MENPVLHIEVLVGVGLIILATKRLFGKKYPMDKVCPRCKEETSLFAFSTRENADICHGCADIEEDGVDDLIL